MKCAYTRELINPVLPEIIEGYLESRFALNQNTKVNLSDEPLFRYAKGIRDDLILDTLLLEQDGKQFIIFDLDIGMAEASTTNACKQKIYERFGISPECITIHTTHTHSGPLATTGQEFKYKFNQKYWDSVTRKMIISLEDCLDRLQEVKVMFDSHNISGFFNNRNRPKEEYLDRTYELTFITKETNVPLVRLINMACHPTILPIGNMMISGDFAGTLKRYVQGFLGMPIMFMNGEAGDVSPRLRKHGADWNECLRYGEGIGNQLLDDNNPVELDVSQIKYDWLHYHAEVNPSKQEFYPAMKKKLEEQMKALDPESTPYKKIKYCYLRDVEEKMQMDKLGCDSDCAVVDFGSFRFVTVPSEIDTVLGFRLRFMDDKPTFVFAYGNGFNYYAVNKGEYGDVFESYVTFYPYGCADEMVDLLIEKAQNID